MVRRVGDQEPSSQPQKRCGALRGRRRWSEAAGCHQVGASPPGTPAHVLGAVAKDLEAIAGTQPCPRSFQPCRPPSVAFYENPPRAWPSER
jgi:hypothetical protein